MSATRTANFTVSTAAYTRVTFGASTIEAPGSDWSLSPDASTLQYDGQDTYAFALEACLLEGAIFNGIQAGQRIVFALYNYTSGSGISFTLPTTTSLIYNHTNPAYVPSACTGQVLVPRVYTGNRFAIFALLEFTDVSSGTVLLASSSWTISAMPVACKGSTLNVNVTAQFNGTDLVDGICSDATNPSPNTVAVDNTFDVTVSGHSCASRTGSRCSRNILIEAVCGFEDSDTVDFAETGTPGFYTAHVESELGNLTECVTCENGTLKVKENVTLEVTRLCAETQCEVRVDPPQTTPSPGPQYVPRLCFTCGNSDGGDDGGGGGDDDGDGTPPLPLFPPLVPIGFFPPIVPIFPPTGGAGGGSGGGSGGRPPGKLPILTPLPIGVTLEPTTTGGLQIPPTNFTDTVVFCGASTHGLAILENGTLPETLYICQRVFNGTYAWMPYCTCSSAQSNVSIMYFTTTLYLNSSTTLYLDSSSQLINYGNTFLQTVTIGSGGLQSCSGGTIESNKFSACGGGAPTFINGLIFTTTPPTDPLFPPICEWTCDGPSTSTAEATLTGARAVNVPSVQSSGFGDFCGSGVAAERYVSANYIIPCGGGTLTLNGSNVLVSGNLTAPTIVGNGLQPVNFPEGATFEEPVTLPSGFAVTGVPSPFLETLVVSNLQWKGYRNFPATLTRVDTTATGSFTWTFQRIGSTKFISFSWSGAVLAGPDGFTVGTTTADDMVLEQTPTTSPYVVPSAWRPQSIIYTSATMGVSAFFYTVPGFYVIFNPITGYFWMPYYDTSSAYQLATQYLAYLPMFSYV